MVILHTSVVSHAECNFTHSVKFYTNSVGLGTERTFAQCKILHTVYNVHTEHIYDFELPDVSLRCFVVRQLLSHIYALSSVKFSDLKLWLCKISDKYEVC